MFPKGAITAVVALPSPFGAKATPRATAGIARQRHGEFDFFFAQLEFYCGAQQTLTPRRGTLVIGLTLGFKAACEFLTKFSVVLW